MLHHFVIGSCANRIARWDGTTWQPFGSGTDAAVLSLTTWDPDGSGPLAMQLVAGGGFTTAGGVTVNNIARWASLAPQVTTPAEASSNPVFPSATVTMTAAASNGPLTHQWRRDGVNLMNGPTGSGSTISGATSAVLTITGAQPTDTAEYDCVLTNSCGSVTSNAVPFTVVPPLGSGPGCPGDSNGDQLVNGADLSVLLANFGNSCR